MSLEDLGFGEFFKAKINKSDFRDFLLARVVAEHKGLYRVKNPSEEFLAKITGKQIFEAVNREDYPAVGDWVLITKLDNEQAVIEKVLPRQTIIKRRFGDKNRQGEKSDIQIIATNIDVGFVIESVDRDYSLNRFERYFSILEDGGVKGAIILNKIDLLLNEEKENKLREIKDRFPDTDIIMTSIIGDNGLAELKKYIQPGQTYCFLGSSGVGKSSLINKLLGREMIKTGEISLSTERGKHTTTARQMYFLDNGGIVIDNPGIREVGLANVGGGIGNFFEEITSLGQKCKYTDCTHIHEPGCAVIEAVKTGKIEEAQYNNYLNLKREADYYELDDLAKKEKDRSFGKFLKQAKKDFKRLDY